MLQGDVSMGYISNISRTLLTIVETRSFIGAAKECMSDDERAHAIAIIAENPECGDLIPGGGGIRKVRHAVGSKGKSGGVRIIYYFHSDCVPVFLLTVFAKNERANLTRSELQQLADVAKLLARSYGE
jgi:hypothetical protein